MKVTKNIISREQAILECPDYVAFVEGDFDAFGTVSANFETAKKGVAAITAVQDGDTIVFVKGKISAVNHNDPRAVDGPIVRFGNDEATWRVDGNKYAHVGKIGKKAALNAVNACIAASV